MGVQSACASRGRGSCVGGAFEVHFHVRPFWRMRLVMREAKCQLGRQLLSLSSNGKSLLSMSIGGVGLLAFVALCRSTFRLGGIPIADSFAFVFVRSGDVFWLR